MDKTGGQAFPSRELKVANKEKEIVEVPKDGMTLRDYFASVALRLLPFENYEGMAGEVFICVAKDAYSLADAMLKERSK